MRGSRDQLPARPGAGADSRQPLPRHRPRAHEQAPQNRRRSLMPAPNPSIETIAFQTPFRLCCLRIPRRQARDRRCWIRRSPDNQRCPRRCGRPGCRSSPVRAGRSRTPMRQRRRRLRSPAVLLWPISPDLPRTADHRGRLIPAGARRSAKLPHRRASAPSSGTSSCHDRKSAHTSSLRGRHCARPISNSLFPLDLPPSVNHLCRWCGDRCVDQRFAAQQCQG